MERPTSVTVFGILNIVFGGFGLMGLCCAIGMLDMANADDLWLQAMRHNALFHGWMIFAHSIGFLGSIALCAAGIGLLLLKEWARVLSIVYGILAIVLEIVGTIISVVVLLPAVMSRTAGLQGPAALGPRVGAIGATIGGCFGLVYPVLLLIFMTRPKVVAAFKAQPDAPDMPGNVL